MERTVMFLAWRFSRMRERWSSELFSQLPERRWKKAFERLKLAEATRAERN
jgi:hypothetical protein